MKNELNDDEYKKFYSEMENIHLREKYELDEIKKREEIEKKDIHERIEKIR